MSSQVDAIGQVAGGPAVGLVGSWLSVQAALVASALTLSPVCCFTCGDPPKRRTCGTLAKPHDD
jgi:hypothetical protein